MHPSKVRREHLQELTDLPNIGPSLAADLRLLGIHAPAQLAGHDAFALYQRLSEITRARQDPCVLDTFMSITDFMAGNPAKPWWHYTQTRKLLWPSL